MSASRTITYAPIGVVRSPYTTLDGMPLQTVAADEVEATVDLDARVHGALRIRGVDLLDGTPVLDVKPYVPLFDARDAATVRTGWFAAAAERVRSVRSDRRYGA